jgi:hypothetical protein
MKKKGKEDKPISLIKMNSIKINTFLAIHFAIAYVFAVYGSYQADKIKAIYSDFLNPRSLLAFIIPVFTLAINGLMGTAWKEIVVAWRLKHPLPGCRAFSDYAYKDDRIDLQELDKKYGPLPKDPRDQNTLWYKIYNKNKSEFRVMDVHGAYLLMRDLTGISVVLLPLIPICLLIAKLPQVTIEVYFGLLILQFLLLSRAANRYGIRFVCTVLSVDAQQA